MREFLSLLFDMATDPLPLPVEPVEEWIILGAIYFIAYIASFKIVSGMYADGSISGRTVGSLDHWIIRFLIFVLVWFVTYWVIVFGQWAKTHLTLVLSVLSTIVVIGIGVFFALGQKKPGCN